MYVRKAFSKGKEITEWEKLISGVGLLSSPASNQHMHKQAYIFGKENHLYNTRYDCIIGFPNKQAQVNHMLFNSHILIV